MKVYKEHNGFTDYKLHGRYFLCENYLNKTLNRKELYTFYDYGWDMRHGIAIFPTGRHKITLYYLTLGI